METDTATVVNGEDGEVVYRDGQDGEGAQFVGGHGGHLLSFHDFVVVENGDRQVGVVNDLNAY